ncbi:hypothetical protein V2J09_012360 [Rumex salicifolius]
MAALTTSLPPHSNPSYQLLAASNPKFSSPKFNFEQRNQFSFAIATIPIKRRKDLSIVMALNPAQQERVIIPNKIGEKLVGILHDTGSKDIVVVCHGFTSSKNDKTMVNLATGLEAEGITAFRFDFSGNGESEGSFAYGNYAKEADEIDAVVQHFNGANRVVTAVVGHSKGGDDVILYASKFHDVRAIVNLSGRFNMERGIAERLGEDFMERLNKDGYIDVEKGGKVIYRVTKESLVERLNTNMREISQKIDKDCRVLTVHGSADEIIPVEDGYEFAKMIPNHKLHIVQGADHCYNNHQEELVSVVVNFIKACIQQDKDAA